MDLKGKADARRLAVGGTPAAEIGDRANRGPGDGLRRGRPPDGYGPIAGILMIAPSPGFADPGDGSPVPLAIILPMCDGDVINQEGQAFYEGADSHPVSRPGSPRLSWTTPTTTTSTRPLGDDPFGRQGRPDCAMLLEPKAQQTFLGDYAVDFFATLFGNTATAQAAKARLGYPACRRHPSFTGRRRVSPCCRAPPNGLPSSPRALTMRSALTGWVGRCWRIANHFFCEEGHYTPTTRPDKAPCRRSNVVDPRQSGAGGC